ncbi:hypothetical protein WAI453_011671 [Rhynchosporium graminicola]
MSLNASKEVCPSIARPSLSFPDPTFNDDIEKATTCELPPSPCTYGTFSWKDKFVSRESSKKTGGSHRETRTFSIIITSLLGSLFLVGAFTLSAFIIVAAVMRCWRHFV